MLCTRRRHRLAAFARPTATARVTLALVLIASPAILLDPQLALAETGTVSGRIVNSEGEPIADVSVGMPDRGLRGRTDADGRFSLYPVPVGSWLLRVAIAGKEPAQRTVRVDAGRTTIADFKLREKPFVAAVVTVRGDKATAIREDASTRTVVSSEKLSRLPITSYQEAIALTAGVTSVGGKLHFRMGRADEVLTLVNGVPSRNPLQAEGVDLGMLALEGTEQILGGMDARYGNALSGVIAITTREGSDKFGGEVRYFTDRYGEQDKSFTNYERLSVGFGGPFVLPRTNYYLSFQGTYSDTYLRSAATHREHRFLDFIRIGNKQSNATNFSSKLTWKLSSDQKLNLELIRNSSVNGMFHNRWNRRGFVQVLADSTAPSDGTIDRRFGTWSYYPVDSTFLPMNTAEHLPVREQDYLQLALGWKHSLARNMIYSVRLSRQEWTTTEDVLDRQPWQYEQQPNQYYDPFNRTEGPYYVTNGDYPLYERRRALTHTLNMDLTAHADSHHVMIGGEYTYNDLQFLFTHFPNVLDGNGNYGFNRDEFRNYNPEGSFFIQDRWQFEGMVVNAGIRYDSFSVGSRVSSETSRPVKTQWSPRIGIAHPISSRDVMSFHYGRLFQLPDRLHLYQGRNISAQARGNPDLSPETTISYQLAVQHLFTEDLYLQCSVYFKDIFGLLTTVDREVPEYAITVPTYVNGDYASARGFDITLIKKHRRGYSGELNYTYGKGTGTASDPNRALASSGNLRDQYKPNSEQPLTWDQRHNLVAMLRLGGDDTWGATFQYQFGTGLPYTPHQRQERRQDPALVHSRRLPPSSTLSVQAERFFQVWGQHVTFYLQGTNLLDARNIANLQPDLWPHNQVSSTSYITYYTETGRAGGAFLTADRDGDGIEDWYAVNDARVFQQGRVLRMGIGVQF